MQCTQNQRIDGNAGAPRIVAQTRPENIRTVDDMGGIIQRGMNIGIQITGGHAKRIENIGQGKTINGNITEKHKDLQRLGRTDYRARIRGLANGHGI